MSESGVYDLNCRTCHRFKKKWGGKDRSCFDRGKIEMDAACDNWCPNGNLSKSLEQIKEILTSCSYAEVQALFCMLDSREAQLEEKFSIGQRVYYTYGDETFTLYIQNIGDDFIFGITKDGRKFRVMADKVSIKKPT